MPELGYKPVNKYLPPRAPKPRRDGGAKRLEPVVSAGAHPFLRWVDRVLSR